MVAAAWHGSGSGGVGTMVAAPRWRSVWQLVSVEARGQHSGVGGGENDNDKNEGDSGNGGSGRVAAAAL